MIATNVFLAASNYCRGGWGIGDRGWGIGDRGWGRGEKGEKATETSPILIFLGGHG
jgi:hypothetical protein